MRSGRDAVLERFRFCQLPRTIREVCGYGRAAVLLRWQVRRKVSAFTATEAMVLAARLAFEARRQKSMLDASRHLADSACSIAQGERPAS